MLYKMAMNVNQLFIWTRHNTGFKVFGHFKSTWLRQHEELEEERHISASKNVPGQPVNSTAVPFHIFKGLTGASSGSHYGDNTTSQLEIINTSCI